MSIASILDPISSGGGLVRFENLDSWRQGRTLYGGASALIAYTAAVRAFPGLPPLRAAQIAFVAPPGPEVELRREIVRQGRNVAQVRSEIWCEGRCMLTAFWLFGGGREPNAAHPAAPIADWPGPPHEAQGAMTGREPNYGDGVDGALLRF
ncbi:MAG: acyl-CoA thioesterase domain-containing protein [Erythrobacter sp.]|jgi:acyl-CoA thioesterase